MLTSPAQLSRLLELAFEDVDEVKQFVVEHYGWAPGTDPEEALWHGVGTAG